MDLSIAGTTQSFADSLRSGVTARDASRLADHELFGSVLARTQEEQPKDAKAQARKAAEDFVAQSLVEPVLKQMREMSQAQAPFAPNQAEKAFRTMLDNAMAQRVVRSGHWPLVDKVTDRILARSGPQGQVQPRPLEPLVKGTVVPAPIPLEKRP